MTFKLEKRKHCPMCGGSTWGLGEWTIRIWQEELCGTWGADFIVAGTKALTIDAVDLDRLLGGLRSTLRYNLSRHEGLRDIVDELMLLKREDLER